jgi:hypothetical protein
MGRKAKNKQPAPIPFPDSNGTGSKGKRKADIRDGQSKKAKVSAENGKTAAVKRESKPLRGASSSSNVAKGKKPSVLVNGDAEKLQEAEMK